MKPAVSTSKCQLPPPPPTAASRTTVAGVARFALVAVTVISRSRFTVVPTRAIAHTVRARKNFFEDNHFILEE